MIFNAGMIPNIKENPRNRKATKRGRKRLFNAAMHALRMRVERTFAWEDKFKRLLLRFERIQQGHYGMKLLAYTLINLRAFCSTKTRNQLRAKKREFVTGFDHFDLLQTAINWAYLTMPSFPPP